MRIKLTLSTVIGFLLAFVAIFFVVRSFIGGLAQAENPASLFSFQPVLFLASFVVLQIHFMLAAVTWWRVMSLSGAQISLKQAYTVHYLSQIGKYIPGKVWAMLGKVGLSRKAGASTSAASHAIILETLLIIVSVMLLSLPIVPMMAASLGIGKLVSTIVVVVIALLVLVGSFPAMLGRILRFFSRLTRQDIRWDHPDITAILKTLPLYIIMFFMMGISFVLLALSFGIQLPFWPGVIVFPAAVAAGFAVLPAPGGLGIREISLVWILGVVLSESLSIPLEPGKAELISIVARLWITIGEMFAFLIALKMRKHLNK